ncbi:MAG: immunoglobulin domain-containing protein [Phycisphaerales bacterium]|nr:immunoglobulin domain-containing protein [Phycisphaerales bacterium]
MRALGATFLAVAANALALPPEQSNQAAKPPSPCRILRPPFADRSSWAPNLWPGGVVPFVFDATVNSANRARTYEAMAELQRAARLTFVPQTDEGSYLYIQDLGFGNASYVGCIGGPQEVDVADWDYKYIICHELMHAVGMFHEHQRPDRDAFVQINWANIDHFFHDQFTVDTGAATFGAYDFDSVMHYDPYAFSTNGLPTISARPGYEQYNGVMGQLSHLSGGDIVGLQSRYGAATRTSSTTLYARTITAPSSNDWFDESEATGGPAGGCDASPDQFSYNDVVESPDRLTASEFDAFRLPPMHVITGARVDVYCRYDTPSSQNNVIVTVGGTATGSLTTPNWNQAGGVTTCNWRMGSGGNISLPLWSRDENLINGLTVAVRWGHSTDGSGGGNRLRVNSFRIVVDTELDSDGDGVPDSADGDRDGDGVQNGSDCAPDDGSAWRTVAYADADSDGVRDSAIALSVACFGLTLPPGFTANANGPDNCPLSYNPDQSDCDGDGLGNACDSFSSPQVVQGPVTRRVRLGETVVFSVIATGTGPLTYQWMLRDLTTPCCDIYLDVVDAPGRVTGATTPTLTISNVAASDGNSYLCVVRNSCGAVASADATLIPTCRADINLSGDVTVQDLFDFLTFYFGGDPRGDFNRSGGTSAQDIFDFLNAYFTGCN